MHGSSSCRNPPRTAPRFAKLRTSPARMPERPKGAACKAVIRGFKSRSALFCLISLAWARSSPEGRFMLASLDQNGKRCELLRPSAASRELLFDCARLGSFLAGGSLHARFARPERQAVRAAPCSDSLWGAFRRHAAFAFGLQQIFSVSGRDCFGLSWPQEVPAVRLSAWVSCLSVADLGRPESKLM